MNFALSAKYNKTSSPFQLCCSVPLSQSFPYTFKKVFLSGASQLEAHKCYIKRSCRRSLRAQKALFRARHMFYKYQVSLPGFFFFSPIWNCSLRLSIQSKIQTLDRALQKIGATIFECLSVFYYPILIDRSHWNSTLIV